MQKDDLVTVLSQMVGGGRTLEAAVRNLRMLGTDENLLEAAIADYEMRVRRIRSLSRP